MSADGYWVCMPDCERPYGGTHHGCTVTDPAPTTTDETRTA